MLAVPPALLESAGLSVGAGVGVSLDGGRLVIERCARPGYTLEELLSQCETPGYFSPEETEWLESPAIGRELL
jgi:antitoxin ChpS